MIYNYKNKIKNNAINNLMLINNLIILFYTLFKNILKMLLVYFFQFYKNDFMNAFFSLNSYYQVYLFAFLVLFLYFIIKNIYNRYKEKLKINNLVFFMIVLFVMCFAFNFNFVFSEGSEGNVSNKEKIISTLVICGAFVGGIYLYKYKFKPKLDETHEFIKNYSKDYDEMSQYHVRLENQSQVVIPLHGCVDEEVKELSGRNIKLIDIINYVKYKENVIEYFQSDINELCTLLKENPSYFDSLGSKTLFTEPVYFSPLLIYRTFGKEGYEIIKSRWLENLDTINFYHCMALLRLPYLVENNNNLKENNLGYVLSSLSYAYNIFLLKSDLYVDMYNLKRYASNPIFEGLEFNSKSSIIAFDISILVLYSVFGIFKFAGFIPYNPVHYDAVLHASHRAVTLWTGNY